MIKKILVPLNRSSFSHKIFPEIQKFFPPEGHQLVLYYITKPPKGSGFAATDYRSNYALEDGEPLGPKAHPVFPSQEEDSIQSDVEVALLPIANDLKEKGYEISTQTCLVDEVTQEIVRIVKRDKVDLIAMSTRAHVGMKKFFFDDLAQRVLKQVDIPLFLFHPED